MMMAEETSAMRATETREIMEPQPFFSAGWVSGSVGASVAGASVGASVAGAWVSGSVGASVSGAVVSSSG